MSCLLTTLADAFLSLAALAAERCKAFARRPAATSALNAFVWLTALMCALAGDQDYFPTPKPPRQGPPPPSHASSARKRTHTAGDNDAAQLRRIRHAFATVPLGVIAARIARRLGLRPGDDLWPDALTKITQTPAQLFAPKPAAPPPAPQAKPPGRKPLRAFRAPPPAHASG
jgi:hypothetical protein